MQLGYKDIDVRVPSAWLRDEIIGWRQLEVDEIPITAHRLDWHDLSHYPT